jgi:S-disulfanyl-L-cysteine oxidoreductase SoxD
MFMSKYARFMSKYRIERFTLRMGLGVLGSFMAGIVVGLVIVWMAPGMGDKGEAQYHIGRPATDTEIRAWNIDISPTGEGLPPGEGTVGRGAKVYAAKCAGCHGPTGTEGPQDRLIGGQGTLATDHPIKTVGSYWPYATTLYDYLYRAMPLTAPQSLTPEEIYSVIAWILYHNDIIPEDQLIDAKSLPAIQMPNRDGFVPDPRPDFPAP